MLFLLNGLIIRIIRWKNWSKLSDRNWLSVCWCWRSRFCSEWRRTFSCRSRTKTFLKSFPSRLTSASRHRSKVWRPKLASLPSLSWRRKRRRRRMTRPEVSEHSATKGWQKWTSVRGWFHMTCFKNIRQNHIQLLDIICATNRLPKLCPFFNSKDHLPSPNFQTYSSQN